MSATARPVPVVSPAPTPVKRPEVKGLPRHVAIILDGNGRWATQRGLPRPAGHAQGSEAVRTVVQAALNRGVQYLSLFAFSSLNWKRPVEEVNALMKLFEIYLSQEAARLAQAGVRLRVLGDLRPLPESVRAAVDVAAALPLQEERLTLNLAVNYGAREELLFAVRALTEQAARGTLDPERIDAERLEGRLFTAGQPPVDVVIRTAGERRLSNFLLWQSAYAELVFTDLLWPDFTAADFDAALTDYASRRRTFGGLIADTTSK